MSFISFSPIILQGQDNSKVVYADSLKDLGKSLTKEKLYNKSDSVLRIAKKIFEEGEDWSNYFVSISSMQKNALKRNEHRQWIDSLTIYRQVIPDSNDFISYKFPYKMGGIYNQLSETYSALQCFQEANRGFQSIHDSNIQHEKLPAYILSTKKRLAGAYIKLGDNLAAIQYGKESASLALELGDTSLYLDQLFNVGSYYFYHGNNEESIRYFKLALQEGADASDVYPDLAKTYIYCDSLAKAEEYLTSDLNDENDRDLYFSLALLYAEKNENKKEIEARLKGIDIVSQSKYQRTLIKQCISYAQMQKRFGNEDEAIKYVQKVLKIKYPEDSFSDIYDRPPIQDGFPDIWILEAFWLKASYFSSKYEKSNDNRDLNEAIFYYDFLFGYFEKLRLQYYSTDSKYQMGDYGQQIYTEALDFYLQLSQETGGDENLEKAMSLAQRANSFVLKNEVDFRRAMQLANVEVDKIENYLRLAALASNGEYIDDNDPIADFDKFNSQLLKEYPALANYQEDNSISIENIQSNIDSNSILIKYHYFENQLYRFMVSKEQVLTDVIQLDSTSQGMTREILAFNTASKTWDESAYRKSSKTIYDLILGDKINEDEFNGKTHLIIIPDGPLKNLSFNSLVTSDNNGPLSAEDYLINTHAVSYLFYCSQLNYNTISQDFNGGFVGFGLEYDDEFLQEIIADYKKNDGLSDSNNNRSFSLKKLKFADDETLNAASILGGKSYINNNANLQNVMDEISNFSIVHFSAHALVDMDDYLESAIIFYEDRTQKYQLKYSDILNLNLKSDLVVLSACQTGIGKGVEGEAMASLSKAFIQSGCKSTVGAFWEVPDQSTMKVMDQFYTNLKDGLSKAEAMRQAQLRYLNDEDISTPRTRMPLHWASWAVYGDNHPIPINNKETALLPWILGIGILLLCGWFIIQMFNNSKNN